MSTDEIILRKSEQIERCIKRVKEEYVGHEDEFEENYTIQDAIVLNIQRACEAAIDLATHIIRIKKLGLPQNARDNFAILEREKIIDSTLSNTLQNMVGYRNIAIHDYDNLSIEITRSVIQDNLSDLLVFVKIILQKF